MSATRRRLRPSLLVLALAALGSAGCPDRTSVGDSSVVPRDPYGGGWYDECSELACARSCPSDAGTRRGECRWESMALSCRCVDRAAAECDVSACRSECSSLGYSAFRCDAIGCRCYRSPETVSDADAADAGEAEDGEGDANDEGEASD